MLQLSRRESGAPERFLVRPWLEDFALEFSRTLELQEGELAVEDVPGDLEVRMDKSHLRQVLWNLCDNAVKYASETGGILVELHAGFVEAQGRPYLEVRDHGLGVDSAAAEQIFEPFYTTREPGQGTGLGLTVSSRLIKDMGGVIRVSASPGEGTRFAIFFPLEAAT